MCSSLGWAGAVFCSNIGCLIENLSKIYLIDNIKLGDFHLNLLFIGQIRFDSAGEFIAA